MLDLTKFAQEVHAVAVEHGWWASEAHRAGHAVYVEEIDWTATGKASINEKELKAEWQVQGMDWARTVSGWPSG